ncbi:MAG: large-conductance mechanosensitive channel protein MscL [Acetilactobacillus jinshanensis]
MVSHGFADRFCVQFQIIATLLINNNLNNERILIQMFKEFKDFISRGNVVDMAVGVIIGSAFTGIVKSLTKNLINPLIGLFMGKIDFSSLKFTMGQASFQVGNFINSIINFLIIAFVVFMIIKLINALSKKEKQTQVSTTDQLLTEIRDLLQTKPNSKQ